MSVFDVLPPYLSLFLGTILFTSFLWYTRQKPNRPPGPKPYPIIGNVFDFPAMSDMISRVQKWKKDYGNIVYMSALGMPLVVLNDLQAVTELFERRGAIYSNRPRFPMIGELCGFDRLPAIASDGPRLRNLRKLLNSEIGVKKADQYQDLMEREVVTYLAKLLHEPMEFVLHNRWFAVDIIMLISYGYRVALKNDYHMELSDRIMRRLSRDSQPGAWLVDLFPIMLHIPAWFPGAHFKRYAQKVRQELDDWVTKPWEQVKSHKITVPSFASKMMELYPNLTMEEEDLVIWSTASMYSAGSDTSHSAMTTFFLAMALNPEVQKRAQEEIDSVVGSEKRLPSFTDQLNLPYICGLVSEIFRWGSILPLGAPRRLIQDDIYESYHLPKGSTVMANVWGLLHDPAVYPMPMQFDPARFVGPNTQSDPRHVVFGFGRRVCPGRYIAEKTIFISIVTTLFVFDITQVPGYPPLYEFDNGVISQAKPFKCNIVPRSTEHRDLIVSLNSRTLKERSDVYLVE